MNISRMNTSEKISQLFSNLCEHPELNQDLTLGKLIDLLGYRTYGAGILIFALPSVLPLSAIPGIAAFFSLPILFLSLQLIFAKTSPWLPHWLKSKKLDTQKLQFFLKQAIPRIQYAEKIITPRYLFFSSPSMKIVFGIVLSLLSVFLMLPIPFSNMLFGAQIALIALGLMENDGLVLLICLMLSGVTIVFFYQAILLLLTWLISFTMT